MKYKKSLLHTSEGNLTSALGTPSIYDAMNNAVVEFPRINFDSVYLQEIIAAKCAISLFELWRYNI